VKQPVQNDSHDSGDRKTGWRMQHRFADDDLIVSRKFFNANLAWPNRVAGHFSLLKIAVATVVAFGRVWVRTAGFHPQLVAVATIVAEVVGRSFLRIRWTAPLSQPNLTSLCCDAFNGLTVKLFGILKTTCYPHNEATMNLQKSTVPPGRVRVLNRDSINPAGDYVVYWMISARRTTWNFGLQRAIDWARELQKPLVVFEPLRCTYQWNSDRFHAFVIQGMADNAAALSKTDAFYFPYLEPTAGDERGLLKELSRNACVVVSDDFPSFFLPRMTTAAARIVGVQFELIDSNGLYPMRDTDRVFNRAFDFRRHLQKNLLPHLEESPLPNPFAGVKLKKIDSLSKSILNRWPPADPASIVADLSRLSAFPLDHSVTVVEAKGGSLTGEKQADLFFQKKLAHYDESRNHPEEMMTSGLSPYLHFGHVSVHQIFHEVVGRSDWKPDQVSKSAGGQSRGWWGLPEHIESFLDELITWREVGYNMCANTSDFDQYDSLPDWAKKTLAEHENDPREFLYSDEQFEQSQTHDALWNAAQAQLVRTGVIHNYLRMLWGKKILEWSPSPRDALQTMIHLNNKYALDGRNPNSYSGIFWVLGRYDRAWGERPVFGKIRYMSSDNTARKVKVKNYIATFGEARLF